MTEILTTVVGRLTNAPVTRDLGGGREVVSFRMACNHGYLDRTTGQWKESSTSYVSVDIWRKHLGRNVQGSFVKGDPVIAHGRLYVRDYEQEGRTRTAVTLVADAVGPDLNTAMAAVTRVRRTADGSLVEEAGTPVPGDEGAAQEGVPIGPRSAPEEERLGQVAEVVPAARA
ncbi:single-stranded DNA-binding protein [Pseudonocardia halophobica]|uniref:Single-stranded DNA-binding protein n=1 Tax=Pseudonocardia halophobica TaxID=29401 RepID=A0A9W6NV15_9PSEU|nr:single-stranded DNA-binding protein [Pseudonocardia halophobica]GLL10123.1 single-stranded DNA-binding protein [Pseudonocardia halophobica]